MRGGPPGESLPTARDLHPTFSDCTHMYQHFGTNEPFLPDGVNGSKHSWDWLLDYVLLLAKKLTPWNFYYVFTTQNITLTKKSVLL